MPLHVFSFKFFFSRSLKSIVQAAVIEKLLLGAAKVTRRDQRRRCSCCFSCALHFLQLTFCDRMEVTRKATRAAAVAVARSGVRVPRPNVLKLRNKMIRARVMGRMTVRPRYAVLSSLITAVSLLSCIPCLSLFFFFFSR